MNKINICDKWFLEYSFRDIMYHLSVKVKEKDYSERELRKLQRVKSILKKANEVIGIKIDTNRVEILAVYNQIVKRFFDEMIIELFKGKEFHYKHKSIRLEKKPFTIDDYLVNQFRNAYKDFDVFAIKERFRILNKGIPTDKCLFPSKKDYNKLKRYARNNRKYSQLDNS
jgi:hypothetical protein